MSETFEQPKQGPKLGPVRDFKDLPPEKREALGDIDRVLAPAKLDPRVVEVEKALQGDTEPQREPEPEEEPQGTQEDAADDLEALRAILLRDEEVVDPIDEQAAPTEDDLRRFMRCLFGDVQYTKEYSLFGGMLVVKMKDMPPSFEDRIFTQLSQDQRAGAVDTQDDWDLSLDRYRMITNIVEVLWSGQEIKAPEITDTGKNLGEVFYGFYEQLKNSVVYRALLNTTRVFRRHLDVLTERATDSDFWQVDGPSSPSEDA